MKTISTFTAAALLAAGSMASAGTTVGETDVSSGQTRVHGEETTRAELDRMAEVALERLFETNAQSKVLFDRASGYAVFRATKAGVIVTGAGGTGVAVDKTDSSRTYMHMGSAGLGLGAGVQSYRLIMMFENDQAYQKFVSGRWDASTNAQASAGKAGANATSSFSDGVAVYQLTDKGLMAQADLSGTRFWKDDDLNVSEQES